MKIKTSLFFLIFLVLLLSCDNDSELAKSKEINITDIIFHISQVQPKTSSTSRIVPIDSYSLGYQYGCAASKDHSLLTHPQTLSSNVDMEQYSSGLYHGFQDCRVVTTTPPPSGGGVPTAQCGYADCGYSFNPATNDYTYTCSFIPTATCSTVPEE